MAHFILAPSGSHGDVHPFIALGLALQARGHTVAMSTSVHFEPLARAAGFEFEAVGTEEDFQNTVNDPNLWHPTKALRVIFHPERARRGLRQSYEHLARHAARPQAVIVAGTLALSAPLAHEVLGTPLVTVHLQPMACSSISDPPVLAGFNPRWWWPRWSVRTALWIADRALIDPVLMPLMNGLRTELNLKPMRRIWGPWRNSATCILGLFPSWYGQARDWPEHMHATGFVRFDQSATMPLSPTLDAFLNDSDAPVVISFGSAMRTGRPHFEAALAACSTLGKRALLLARGGAQIPPLPPGALHADYAPFSQVFPRAAAVIHHGGMGTSAQALAAGLPQLIMPLAFDQFDNAARLVKLGVARSVPAKRFTAKRATAALQALLDDRSVPPKCAEVQARMTDDPLPGIVAILESQVRTV